jgi:hypothetical protein
MCGILMVESLDIAPIFQYRATSAPAAAASAAASASAADAAAAAADYGLKYRLPFIKTVL